jgi:hypothetical protein
MQLILVISKIAQLAHVVSHQLNIILLNSIEDKGMPQNQIQFQKEMSLSRFIEQYGTEEKCNQAFENARWGRGYTCPKCDTEDPTVFYQHITGTDYLISDLLLPNWPTWAFEF